MKEIIINILLAMSAFIWVVCILIYCSLQIYYIIRQDGFIKKMFFGIFKFDYTAGSEDMS